MPENDKREKIKIINKQIALKKLFNRYTKREQLKYTVLGGQDCG